MIKLKIVMVIALMLKLHDIANLSTHCMNLFFFSGAENKQGFLWDRHYGICLQKYSHNDVVNAVAFNPKDPEMLVSVSDDWSIKIWRSLNRQKEHRNREDSFATHFTD